VKKCITLLFTFIFPKSINLTKENYSGLFKLVIFFHM
jgi:hypothetical protein